MHTGTAIAIARRIDAIADWRRERETLDLRGMGPEVAARSRRSADGLKALADHVAALPEDHPDLARLRTLAFSGGEFDPGPTLLTELGRFRFHDPEQDVVAFLHRMVEYAEQDISETAMFGGPQVPGDEPFVVRVVVDDEDDDLPYSDSNRSANGSGDDRWNA